MNKSLLLSLLLSAFLLTNVPALKAQEQEIESEAPIQEVFMTELVYPQEKREVQFTFSPTFAKRRDSRVFQSPVTIEYGLTNKWQLELEWSRVTLREDGEPTVRGAGDLRFGTKYSFMNMGESNFHSAVGFEVGVPSGNLEKELSEGFMEYEPYFILAKDFPGLHRAQVFTQVGMGFVQRVKRHHDADENEPAAHEFTWNSGVFVPFKKFALTSEINWLTNRWNNGGEENELYYTPGIVIKPLRSWEIGFGLPIGINKGADNRRAMIKLTYEF